MLASVALLETMSNVGIEAQGVLHNQKIRMEPRKCIRKRITLNEEQMSSCILFVVREVLYDTIYIMRCRHKQVHSLEFWLRISVAGDGFNHWLELSNGRKVCCKRYATHR